MTNSKYPPLLKHILDGKEYGPILKSPDLSLHREQWRELMRSLIACPPADRAMADSFHAQWHTYHHHIRALVDDDELIMDLLWVWLPRYDGPDVLLYRGENIDRMEQGKIGTAWTERKEAAEMFASGLNALGKGGAILQTLAPSAAIIAGPSNHSKYLGEHEYTVDTRRLAVVTELERFSCG